MKLDKNLPMPDKAPVENEEIDIFAEEDMNPTEEENSSLSASSDEELIEELKKRGYEIEEQDMPTEEAPDVME